jgi:hypothetical protein
MKQGRVGRTTRTRRSRRRHLQEKHPSLARKPASVAVAARRRSANGTFPLSSKAGASSEGRGKLVLTSVATGRSAGVGEEGWRGLSARKKETTARQHGSRGSRCARRRWVWLLPTGGSGLRGERHPPFGRPLFLPPSFFLLPPSPSLTAVWTGKDFPPKEARVGRSRGAAAAATYSGGRTGERGRPRCSGGVRGTSRRRHGGLPDALVWRHQRKGKSPGVMMATSA